MISNKFKEMLSQKSVIREISVYANARGAEIGYDNVYDFSLGNPSVAVPEKFNDIVKQLLDTRDPLALHGYSPSHGLPEVRTKVAQSLANKYNLPYKMEHIFMTSGAASSVAHAVRSVVTPGEEVIAFAPFFPEYRPYVTETGAKLTIVPADLESFQINFEEFEKVISKNTAAVLLNTPNNPSGVVYSTETIQHLASILKKKSEEFGQDIYIISDEPYREIVFEGVDAPIVSKFYENTIICYSFSKSLSLPGERIGYVAVNPLCKDATLIVDMCTQISRGIGHNCPSSLIQLAVSMLLEETADLKVYEKNSTILYNELTKLGFSCVKPGGTFYIFPKAPIEDAKEFCQKALEYDLAIVPGDSFGAPGYFRMAYCVPTQKVENSLEAIRKLAAYYGME